MNSTSYYLEAMGITRWRLRVGIYRLISEKNEEQGILAAQLSADEKNRAAELTLLSGIAKALRTTAVPQTVLLENIPCSGLIILGEDIAQQYTYINAAQRIVTHSLQKMLKNPALKAEAWKALKVFIAN